MEPSPGDITQILLDLAREERPNRARTDALMKALYTEMHALAEHLMRRERGDHTLQPTALVHEAYLRLVDQSRVRWQDRAHFLGVATQVMRRLLVDWARRHEAAKRGGGWQRVTLDEGMAAGASSSLDILALDEAMTRLAAEDARAARVAELRMLGGLSVKETGEVLGIATRTVEKDWTLARLWLARALADEPGA